MKASFMCSTTYLDPGQTKSMTQEATRLIQKALTEPEPFSWEGEHFQFPRVSVWPRPLQQPFIVVADTEVLPRIRAIGVPSLVSNP